MDILVVNSGSSSIKFAVIDAATGTEHVAGLGERLGNPGANLSWKVNGEKQTRDLGDGDHSAALAAVMTVLDDLGLRERIAGIGHRVVHGGARFSSAVLVDDDVAAGIDDCSRLAPLHNPPNLQGITTCRELFPTLPNAAVFDTAFHSSMPEHAWRYALPDALYHEHGVRRYGFHGTSHQFVAEQALAILDLEDDDTSGLVTCHLGNGCSAAAVRGGKGVDTTMGLTPLEGLVMGTRSGDIDPAIPGFLCDQAGMSIAEVTTLLNKQSGLLGMSGLSNDMRTVSEAAADGNQRAEIAIQVFCYRLAKTIGALAIPLGRLDAVVFTGGIGENAGAIRARVVDQLGVLGLELDPARNANNGAEAKGRITTDGSTAALVVPTNEELMIARQTAALIGA